MKAFFHAAIFVMHAMLAIMINQNTFAKKNVHVVTNLLHAITKTQKLVKSATDTFAMLFAMKII